MKAIYYLLAAPHILAFLFYRHKILEIDKDLNQYINADKNTVSSFVSALRKKEYRNVFYYRLPFYLRHILNITLPREQNLYLHTSGIGSGLHVIHGFSTIVVAERIGRNFTIYQNVTVGWEKTGKPTIGNNVTIYTGAVVSGGITIGNNVRICANAHVRQNIPDNHIAYGNPCVIKKMKQ